MKIIGLNRIEKLTLISRCVKSVTAIIGGSLIISEGHPYITMTVLSIGGVANEVCSYLKDKESAIIPLGNENVNP